MTSSLVSEHIREHENDRIWKWCGGQSFDGFKVQALNFSNGCWRFFILFSFLHFLKILSLFKYSMIVLLFNLGSERMPRMPFKPCFRSRACNERGFLHKGFVLFVCL